MTDPILPQPVEVPSPALPQPVEAPSPALPQPVEASPALPVWSAVTGSKPRPEPLDPPMVPFAVAGLAGFAVAGLLVLIFQDWLAAHGHTDWLRICVGGFLVGLPGLATMIRHDARRRRRRALTHAEVTEHPPR